MKPRHLLVTLLALFSSFSAIQAETSATGAISGIILDDATDAALDFVNVVLYKKNTTVPVKGLSTDKDGTFQFANIPSGQYRIEATYVGYVTWSTLCNVANGQHVKLGSIMMKTNSKELGAAEVTGIRSTMKFDIDKRIFSVDQSIAAAGASASDILKDIPSVQVDQEGTVTLRNSSDVTVWINGKPSGLTSDNQGQVLEQLPAESIDRVEVVTNPSSKYSAEGTAGIINIILKKDRKAGYFGSLRAGVSNPDGYNFGGNFNYSSPKIDFYANIGRRVNTNHGTGSGSRQTFTASGDTSYMNSSTNRNFNMNGLFFRSGIDYHFTDKQTLSLSGFGMDGHRNFDSNIDYQYLNASQALSRTVQRQTTSDGGHSNAEITLDYQWEIGEDHKLQSTLSYGRHSTSDNNLFTQSNYDASHLLTSSTSQVQTGPSSFNDIEFQTDYSQKISDTYRFETGVKSDWTKRNSENGIYNSDSFDHLGDPVYYNQFDYNEKINAAYGTFTGKVGTHFGYQLGLRGEMTDISFTSVNKQIGQSIDHSKNYFSLFPSLFLTYTFSEGNDLQLNYSRRIQRPRGRMLNPFTDITDSTNIQFGNPDLDPVFSHSFELNLIRTTDDLSLSASMYHRIAENDIQSISYLDNGVMFQTSSNVTRNSSSGLELVGKSKLTNLAELTGTIDGFYSEMDPFTYRGYYYKGNSGFSWNARLNGTLIFSKSLTGELSGFYNAPAIIAQGKSKSNYTLDAGLRKSFFDKQLQIALNGRNLLNSFKFASTTWGSGFYQTSSSQFFSRSIQLNVTWNFGNMKPKKDIKEENNNSNSGNNMDSEY